MRFFIFLLMLPMVYADGLDVNQRSFIWIGIGVFLIIWYFRRKKNQKLDDIYGEARLDYSREEKEEPYNPFIEGPKEEPKPKIEPINEESIFREI